MQNQEASHSRLMVQTHEVTREDIMSQLETVDRKVELPLLLPDGTSPCRQNQGSEEFCMNGRCEGHGRQGGDISDLERAYQGCSRCKSIAN